MGELSPGLRRVAKGFKAADGYNVRDLNEGRWTPAMKRRVSMYFHELQELTGQEKIVVHTRSPARLANAQAIGGHDPKFKFKVAFVPGTSKSKIIWNADNTLTVRERGYDKRPVLFNPESLARDSAKEVARVLRDPKLKGVNTFGLLTGKNVMFGEMPDRHFLLEKVQKLMFKYDGRKEIPRSSGNRGDKPSAHHYSRWLFGVQGFRFAPQTKHGPVLDAISQGNAKLRRRRAAMRKKAKRG